MMALMLERGRPCSDSWSGMSLSTLIAEAVLPKSAFTCTGSTPRPVVGFDRIDLDLRAGGI